VIGSPVAGRDHADLENQIGFYNNNLSLRTKLNGDESFVSLLQKVKENTLAAYAHQVYPFDRLVDDLQLTRDMSRFPIFDVAVVLQTTEAEGHGVSEMTGVAVEGFDTGFKVSATDLRIEFKEFSSGLRVGIDYSTDLFEQRSVVQFLDHLVTVFETVVAAPDTTVSDINITAETAGTEEKEGAMAEGFNFDFQY